ncbi:hypothetical protein BU23DRAFT_575603 [Bimuria novae-zelandiae CBS 107.79]|uniref:Uncharacterized protein n=1 Tax=Bimuria novae-zelandiae CBS 107.79 TaxID=1447943 RepID=A0A6A5UKN8_9PLEO|nr:hypothetical protein BU23DRAFT_575603 [Bimuria novae-zelandiae CBS 107.79]
MDLGRSLLAPICTWNGRDRLLVVLALGGYLGAYFGAAAVLDRLWRVQQRPCLPWKPLRPSSPGLATAEVALRGGDDTASSCRALTLKPTSEAFGRTSLLDHYHVYAHASSFLWILPVGAITTAWVAFVVLNFLPGHTPNVHRVAPVLDSIFRPSTRVDVVVSMYEESLESVTSLLSSLRDIPTLAGARVHVYAKASPTNLAAVKQ